MAARDRARCCFVAGSSGYTGREVVRQLLAGGERVVAHVRPGSPSGARWAERFAVLGAEVDRTEWTSDAMGERLVQVAPDVVFALLGITRAGARREARRSGSAPTYQSVDYGLTALLLRACEALARPPLFIYLSAAGVGGAVGGAYYEARRAVERELRASSVPWVIARPGLITGPDRDEARRAERAAGAILGGAGRLAAALGARGAARRLAPVTNVELAGALVRLARDRDAVGKVIEAGELRS